MPVSEHSKRIRLRPWLAAAFLVIAGSFAACSFPEDDYGFGPSTPKDAAPDVKADAADAKTEEAATLPEGGDDTPEVGPDVIDEPDAAPEDADAADDVIEADAPSDVIPDVPGDAPDAPFDAPVDVEAGPDGSTLPPLNVWHIPTNPEPPTVTMRNKRYPLAGTDAFIYVGVQPIGSTTGAKLYWWWSGETTPHEVAFAWDTNNVNNEYWKASFKMPARPIGTFRYYIEVTPKFPAQNAVTYLYGTDSTTNKTTVKSVASASPYKPDVRLPTAAGDAGGVSEIVITEVMVNALSTPEDGKEWFEVYNAASVPVTLAGCKIGDNAANHIVNNPEFILWPGVYAVFGSTLDPNLVGGFTPDYAWTGSNIELSNSGDLLKVLLPDDTLIDTVNWTSGFGPSLYSVDAHTMQHTTQPPSATLNDTGANWCVSKKPYGTLATSFGTPQAASDNCAQ